MTYVGHACVIILLVSIHNIMFREVCNKKTDILQSTAQKSNYATQFLRRSYHLGVAAEVTQYYADDYKFNKIYNIM